MKYQFAYQKVLDFKEKEKELAKQQYGAIRLQQLEVQEQLNGLESVKEKVYNQYNNVSRKMVRDILAFQDEIEHVNLQKRTLENKSQQLHQLVEQKHLILIEKTKEAKMWNQWKEKTKAVFQKQLDQREQAMLDEMAVLRFSRKV